MVELLERIAKAVESSPTGQKLDKLSNVQTVKKEHKLIAMPSKKKQVIEWFENHPGGRAKSGEWLQENVKPYDEEISYRTWNRYK